MSYIRLTDALEVLRKLNRDDGVAVRKRWDLVPWGDSRRLPGFTVGLGSPPQTPSNWGFHSSRAAGLIIPMAALVTK